jgi:PTH2 family peptidyl-tRNA hydrolase
VAKKHAQKKNALARTFDKLNDLVIHQKMGEFKQAIVLRNDLDMGKGKMVVQGSHASQHGLQKAVELDKRVAYAWEEEGCRKIVLKATSQKELEQLAARANKLNIPWALIRDAGLTQLPPGTITALAVGPWKAEDVDKVTGELKLL